MKKHRKTLSETKQTTVWRVAFTVRIISLKLKRQKSTGYTQSLEVCRIKKIVSFRSDYFMVVLVFIGVNP